MTAKGTRGRLEGAGIEQNGKGLMDTDNSVVIVRGDGYKKGNGKKYNKNFKINKNKNIIFMSYMLQTCFPTGHISFCSGSVVL